MATSSIGISRCKKTLLLGVASLLLASECLASPSISISPTSGPPTTHIVVAGRGFKPFEAVDIYFDRTDEARAVANASGAFSGIAISAPRSATPGKHWVSAVQRLAHIGAQVPFLVNTNWDQFHFAANHIGVNPYENVLSPTTVPSMTLDWRFAADGQVGLSAAEANGIVYVPGVFQLSALRADTGAVLWQYTVGSFLGGPTVLNGTVYFSSADGNVHALNARTGAVQWISTIAGGIPGAPLTVANGLVFANSNTTLTVLDAATGSQLWSYNAGGSILCLPAVANGVVYFGAEYQNLYALNATTGNVLWQVTLPFYFDSAPTVVNGVVYVGAGSSVFALNASNGQTLWQSTTDSFERTSPAVSNGVVYAASDAGFLYALNAYTGSQLWNYNTGSGDDGFPPSSPTVANGVVYAGFQNNIIYAFDLATGNLLWEYVTGGAISSTPVIANGAFYIGSWDGYLYAFHPTPALNAHGGSAKRIDLNSLQPATNLRVSF